MSSLLSLQITPFAAERSVPEPATRNLAAGWLHLAPPGEALLRLGGERSKFVISEFRVRGTHRAFDVCGSSPSHLSTQERGEGAHLSCCEIKTLSPCYRGVSRETGDELPTSAESSASHTASDKAVGCESCFHLLGCFT